MRDSEVILFAASYGTLKRKPRPKRGPVFTVAQTARVQVAALLHSDLR